MCGGGPNLTSEKDPKAERLKSEADATAAANATAAAERRQRQRQTLLATGAMGNNTPVTASTVLATGKQKLGS